MLFADTDPQAEAVLVALLRQAAPARKLAMVGELNATVRTLAHLDHATAQLVATDPDRLAYVASAEDTILAKLDWYRKGGEVSERKWRDVLGFVKVQDDRLDWDYLGQQAASLGVADLLERLRQKR